MIFDNLKFYLKDYTTGELDIRFLCEDCRKEMDRPRYTYEILRGKGTGYHFVCEDCYLIRKEFGDPITPIKEHQEKQKDK